MNLASENESKEDAGNKHIANESGPKQSVFENRTSNEKGSMGELTDVSSGGEGFFN